MQRYWYVLVAINVLSFILYGWDKAKAKRHAWRIPERDLLFVGIAGGALGALLGMQVFHHKTKHRNFIVINTAALIVQVILVIWAIST